MEDRFVAAQSGLALDSVEIDRMLTATDWLSQLQAVEEAKVVLWLDSNAVAIDACAAGLHDRHSVVEQMTQAIDPANTQSTEEGAPVAERSDEPPDTRSNSSPGPQPARPQVAAPAAVSVRN